MPTTLAAPSKGKTTRTIQKRAAPSIASGFTAQQTTQLTDAFTDALELASYVATASQDAVFAKYFNIGDKDTVNNVFNNILGGDPNGQGSDLLSSITITPDYPDSNGVLACDGETMAEMRDWSTDSPKVIVCDPAGFGHGGIGKSYETVAAVSCGNFDPRVSWKMETLGSILLHEYTHWTKLMAPPLSKETDDDAYGPYGVRQMNKKDATNNADSYSWFATENLWTVICQTNYQDPQPSDDDDPNCDGQVCKAPKSP
ncbi:MAG: hypothetical protein M1821_000628 [Bathelium mastoideum]|nr:MAG: hypothetical protein M1821_000628 [Bathelium mastoideum]